MTIGSSSADTIYVNGNIATVDAEFSFVSSLGVRSGKIIAAGNAESVRAVMKENAQVVDLAGHTVIPGAIDAHGHFSKAIKNLQRLTLTPSDFRKHDTFSIEELIRRFEDYRDSRRWEPGEWIVGHTYSEWSVKEGRLLTRDDLDRVSTTQPVIAAHISGHIFSFNSVGLRTLGIGEIGVNDSRNHIFTYEGTNIPNGIVQGPIAQQFYFELGIPETAKLDKLFNNIEQWYFSYGNTQAQDGKASVADIELYDKIHRNNNAGIDIAIYVDYQSVDKVVQRYPWLLDGSDEHFSFKGIKIHADGTIGSGAHVTRPFNDDPEDYGIEYISRPDLKRVIAKAVDHHWNFLIHAMGDAAIDDVLDVYEEVLKEKHADPFQFRNTINHASAIRPDQLDRVRDLGLILSFYPSAGVQLYELFEQRLGEERAQSLNPVKSALEHGIVTTIHNDSPILEPSPINAWWSAVNRISVKTRRRFGQDERVSVKEGLRLFTINAAYQHGEEDIRGSLEVGKKADFAILDRNPFDIDPEQLIDVKVIATVKDGRVVYGSLEVEQEVEKDGPDSQEVTGDA